MEKIKPRTVTTELVALRIRAMAIKQFSNAVSPVTTAGRCCPKVPGFSIGESQSDFLSFLRRLSELFSRFAGREVKTSTFRTISDSGEYIYGEDVEGDYEGWVFCMVCREVMRVEVEGNSCPCHWWEESHEKEIQPFDDFEEWVCDCVTKAGAPLRIRNNKYQVRQKAGKGKWVDVYA